MVIEPQPQWERLGNEVVGRRRSRGWSQAAVTAQGGPSDTLQTQIEQGRWRPSRGVDESLRKIDAGMQWEPGTASRILSGDSVGYEAAPNTPATAIPSNLAARLNKLFEVMRKKSDPPLSNEAVAEAVTRQTGIPISAALIWEVRNGVQETNPTVQQLRSIATFFGAPESYLIEDAPDPAIDAQLSLLQAVRDTGVYDLAMRASGLTPQALNSVVAIVDHIRELEHLPPITPKDQSHRPHT